MEVVERGILFASSKFLFTNDLSCSSVNPSNRKMMS